MSPLQSFVLVSITLSAMAGPAPAQQRDSDLPPAKLASAHGMRALPPTTQSLNWENVAVHHMPLLALMPALRRLQINPDSDAAWGDWAKLEVDALAPLCALPALEQLTLPYCASLSPAHLRKLAGCQRLVRVQFFTDCLRLEPATVAALAEWPVLRELELGWIVVSADGLAALSALPRLERLVLGNCRELDAAGWAAVCKLKNLRALMLSGLGQPNILARFRQGEQADTWFPDLPSIRALAALPELRELELLECVLVPGALAALPKQVTALTCRGGGLTASQVRELRQLGGLRTLRLGDAGRDDREQDAFRSEVAELLGVLRLDGFHWSGRMSAELRRAIAGQADLRELALPCSAELDFVAGLPKLERLDLWPRLLSPAAIAAGEHPAPPAPAELAVLRASKSLRVVVCRDHELTAAAIAGLREALGPRVELLQRD
jgi:hypothetical protein